MELADMQGLLHEIHSAFPMTDYRLIFEFDEGECRLISIKPFLDLGGVFESLRDPAVRYAKGIPLAIPQVN